MDHAHHVHHHANHGGPSHAGHGGESLNRTALPFLRRGYALKAALRIALVADAASITIMEIVDNALMLAIPGAMDEPIHSLFFCSSMAVALAVAGVAAYPLNRWLIARGKGHALAHGHHQGMAG